MGSYIGLLNVLDTVRIDAVFGTEHAFVTFKEVELAQVGLWSVSVVDFRLDKMWNKRR